MPDALSLSCELVQDLKEGIHLLELYKKPTDLKRKKLSLLSVKELCVLHPPPSTLHPPPRILNPLPTTLNPQPATPNPQPPTLKSQSSTPNPNPESSAPKPERQPLTYYRS